MSLEGPAEDSRHITLIVSLSIARHSSKDFGPAGSTASTSSTAVISVSTIVVVSPASASCTVTPMTAPVSRPTDQRVDPGLVATTLGLRPGESKWRSG